MDNAKMNIYEGNSLGIGAVFLLGGFSMITFSPALALPARGLMLAGGGCVADYIAHYSVFNQVFKGLDLCVGDVYPILKQKTKMDGYILYEFTLPAGLSADDFREKQEAIEQYLGRPIEISYGYKNLLIRKYPRNEKTMYEYEPQKLPGNVPIMLGYDRTGKLISADLASGEPHMYIAGETGSGKSTSLRAIIVNLILHSDVDLYLVDLKNGVEFKMFRDCSCVKGFACDEEEAGAMLSQIMGEVTRRYKLFAAADCEDIKSYNKRNTPLPYQLLIIDEFATLMYEKDTTAMLEQLAAKARACGIHLILATQRPDAKVINGRIKANISNVLGLKTLDRTNSGIIIGHDGLERLRGAGHGIFKRGSDETVLQAPYLSAERAKELIRPHIVAKEKAPAGAENAIDADFHFLDEL